MTVNHPQHTIISIHGSQHTQHQTPSQERGETETETETKMGTETGTDTHSPTDRGQQGPHTAHGTHEDGTVPQDSSTQLRGSTQSSSSDRHSITQMRVESTVKELQNGTYKPLIHLFGRDDNHSLWHIEVHGFKPYFYVPADQAPSAQTQSRVQDVQYGEKAIDGVDMARVVTNTPRDVKQLRDNYDHYEADIPFSRRFLLDTQITSGVSFPTDAIDSHPDPDPDSHTRSSVSADAPDSVIGKAIVHYEQLTPVTMSVSPRIHYVDIEVEDRHGFPDADSASAPLLCLTTYDSYTEEYIVWTRQEPENPPDSYPNTLSQSSSDSGASYEPLSQQPTDAGPEDGLEPDSAPDPDSLSLPDYVAPSTVEVRPFPTESQLLAAYCTYVQRTDPDILTGWNVSYDTTYLFNRLEERSTPTQMLSPDRLSRLNDAWNGSYGAPTFKGRTVFDLLEAYKQLQQTKQQSYQLDDVAQRELGVGKQQRTHTVGHLWEVSPTELFRYNIRDVELLVALEAQEELITFWDETRRLVGCSLESTLNTGDLCDAYILHHFSDDYVLPSQGAFSEADSSPSGGHVFDPITGIRDCIGVLDLKSLYPLVMSTLNASPETKVQDSYTGDTVEAPNGTQFRTDQDGILRTMITDLLEQREQLKSLRNQYDTSTESYARLDRQQAATKVVMNALYGTFGWPRFRLYDPDITEAVTSTGRELITFTADCVEACGYSVIYGDSDSVLIDLPQLSFADIRALPSLDSPSNPAAVAPPSSVWSSQQTGQSSSSPEPFSSLGFASGPEAHAQSSESSEPHASLEQQLSFASSATDAAVPHNHVIAAHAARHPPDSFQQIHPELVASDTFSTDSLAPQLTLAPSVREATRDHFDDTTDAWTESESEQLVTAVSQLFWLQEYLNTQYDLFARDRFGLESHQFVIEAECLYWPYLQAGKKKRYAGRTRWADGRFTDTLSITGFEYTRSDTAPITKRVQQTVLTMLLDNEPSEHIVSYLQDIFADAHAGEIDIWEFAIPEGIRQPLSQYDQPTAHQRGAQYANAVLDTHFDAGSTPRRLYLKSVDPQFWERLKQADTLDPQARPDEYQAFREFRQRTDVICLSDPDQLPPEFVVDMQRMLEKTVRKPLSRVLEATDISWDALTQHQTQPTLDEFM